jgi:hypothetical protein
LKSFKIIQQDNWILHHTKQWINITTACFLYYMDNAKALIPVPHYMYDQYRFWEEIELCLWCISTLIMILKIKQGIIFFSLLWIRPICLFQFRITSEIMNHRQTVGLLGRVISSSQGLYLHMTTQQRQIRTNIHALSGIWTSDPVYECSRPAPQTMRPPDQQRE